MEGYSTISSISMTFAFLRLESLNLFAWVWNLDLQMTFFLRKAFWNETAKEMAAIQTDSYDQENFSSSEGEIEQNPTVATNVL